MKIIKSSKMEIMPGKQINAPLPSDEAPEFSPFILLHHFGPFEVNYLNKFEFEPHPHRGFEAVTILFEGEMEHRDSTGSHGKLSGGDVQWMTAGSGVLHEEKQASGFLEKGGTIHGIQLWVNLPKEHKMSAPKYQDISSSSIKEFKTGKVTERVIAGNYKNETGPAKTFTPITVVHGIMPEGTEVNLEVISGYHSALYITKGSIEVNGIQAGISDLVLLESNSLLKAAHESEYLLISGEPIAEPVVQYGPFVMNTMGEIKQAFLDYREGKFGNIN
jgi:redox-sensitive bicupin YhaK (pirin superfamily)